MAVVLLLVVVAIRYQAENLSKIASGDPVPAKAGPSVVRSDIALSLNEQGKVTASKLEGKVLMINFWASWCAPCMAEMPSIYKLRDRFEARGFEVLAVNLDLQPEDGIKALEKFVGTPKFPVISGHGSELPEKFNIQGVPFTLIVDRSGKIRYSGVGERNWLEKDSVQLIESIL